VEEGERAKVMRIERMRDVERVLPKGERGGNRECT